MPSTVPAFGAVIATSSVNASMVAMVRPALALPPVCDGHPEGTDLDVTQCAGMCH
jgi:hypothetical protein